MTKAIDLTEGSITRTMLAFAVPMIIGNLLQQLYNVADTLIVGQFLGANALAAVGSAYTLMIFLTSVLLGLCMGSGAVFSHRYGAKQTEVLKKSVYVSFVWISVTTLLLNVAVLSLYIRLSVFCKSPQSCIASCTIIYGLFSGASGSHFFIILCLSFTSHRQLDGAALVPCRCRSSEYYPRFPVHPVF